MRGMMAKSTLAVTAFSFCFASFLQFGGMLGYSVLGLPEVKALGGIFPSFWARVPLLDLEFGLLRQLPGGCFENIAEPAYLGGMILCIF